MITKGTPEVSICILNYNHPERINITLDSLDITDGIEYEVVVIDNASTPENVERLRQHKADGLITTLVENDRNWLYSQGFNIGFANTNPASKYIILLNSDVGFLRSDWLTKFVGWMEGTTKYEPAIWNLKPTVVKPGPLDIVSIGWSHDATIYGSVRPEGWCIMFRREIWRDMDAGSFPWLYGLEEMITYQMKYGYPDRRARVGALSQYSTYLVHREGSSGAPPPYSDGRTADMTAWFDQMEIESLDFTIGPDEHDSYLVW